MKISDLICLLGKFKDELGDVNVCVWDDAFNMPNSGFVPCFKENELFSDDCEVIRNGDYLLL